MKYYNEVDFEDVQYSCVTSYDNRNKEVISYMNIEASLDFETSSVMLGEKKFAFMYEWTFGIKDETFVGYGRDWNELLELFQHLHEVYELGHDKRLVVYVQNLGYEFQFMRKYFEWVSVFAVDDRKPIKALCSLGIEFRDSYILSGYSLAMIARNLVSHKIKKLVGDLDYKKVRHSKTPLTDVELAYCENDVVIILYYINEQLAQYGDITKIPLTNTGRVRKYVKDNCFYTDKTHKKSSVGKRQRYKELMQELTLTVEQYTMLKRCFMGGFTHASIKYSGEVMHDVSSIDFTSSYPAVMLAEKFPMGKPQLVENIDKKKFKQLIEDENVGMMFDIRFTNIHSKLTYETYISESKCKLVNATINNGRVFRADELTTTITDIDFRIIQQVYTWDNVEVANVNTFYMQYLPKPIIQSIVNLYADKTTLKDVQGKEVEYLLSKGMLNSVYGMCVTDIIRDEIMYNEGWNIQQADEASIDEQIGKYNNNANRFLYYAWGVWVTAYARKNLWNGILNIGDDYIYSDTDSIKLINYEEHKAYIDWYNADIERKIQAMCSFRKIDYNLLLPKTIKGVVKKLGVWDFEGTYDTFKTLGAKRYMNSSDGKITITIAGLSKQNGANYMMKVADNNMAKVFEDFNDELYIPASETGKNTHTYIDEEMTAFIEDYTGEELEVTSLSSIHLSECDFTLSISKQYNRFLRDFRNGYIETKTTVL